MLKKNVKKVKRFGQPYQSDEILREDGLWTVKPLVASSQSGGYLATRLFT